MATRLALDGLNALDAEELKEALGNESVQLTNQKLPRVILRSRQLLAP
jgi:hypothetical protein